MLFPSFFFLFFLCNNKIIKSKKTNKSACTRKNKRGEKRAHLLWKQWWRVRSLLCIVYCQSLFISCAARVTTFIQSMLSYISKSCCTVIGVYFYFIFFIIVILGRLLFFFLFWYKSKYFTPSLKKKSIYMYLKTRILFSKYWILKCLSPDICTCSTLRILI